MTPPTSSGYHDSSDEFLNVFRLPEALLNIKSELLDEEMEEMVVEEEEQEMKVLNLSIS